MKMAPLREAVENAGFTGVATLQVAGNVIVDLPDEPREATAARIHDVVLAEFGFDLDVIMRTHAELVDARRRNPFVGTQEARYLLTTFLDSVPAPHRVGTLDPDRSPGDEFVVDGAEIFVRYESGVATSKLTLPWFERGLGVRGTARNANTIDKLIDLTR